MSGDRAAAFALAIQERTHAPAVEQLLRAIATAWVDAESGFPSEQEANRWSKVCNAAERVVGL